MYVHLYNRTHANLPWNGIIESREYIHGTINSIKCKLDEANPHLVPISILDREYREPKY
jgi:hypothetical protein